MADTNTIRPESKTIQVNKQQTRAKFDVSTFNEKNRTVEVTAATERAVKMFDWENYETMDEVLVCTSEACDLTRLNSGAPLLDNHMRYGKTSEAVVGVVERAYFQEGRLRALVRFGDSEDDIKLMNKVRDGIVTGVSLGYNVSEYMVTRTEGKRPNYRATKWEPFEISFTPVQADVDSRARSEGNEKHDVTIIEETPVAETENAADADNDNIQTDENNNTNTNTTEMADTKETAEQLAQERSAATLAERQRVEGIRGLAKLRSFEGLEPTFFDAFINDGTSVDTARERALTEWEAKGPKPTNQQAGSATENDKVRSNMANALALRINPAASAAMGEENVRAAAEFKGMNFLRFAEESLMQSGTNTRGMTSRQIATAALGGKVRGLHHTTDFPLLLLDTVNRTLLAQYQQQPRTFMAWSRRTTIADFRPISRVRLSEIFGDLLPVKEGEEYKYATLSESGETYQLGKFGRIIGITWEAIVNDDLSAFSRIPQAFAAKAAINQTKIVYGIILGNPAMADTNLLFSAAHKNYTGTAGNLTTGGTALTEAALDTAYQMFMTQTDTAGDLINVAPKYLVVGPKNATIAMKLTSANYTPNTQLQQPLAQSLGLQVIVDSNITGFTWFLIADPAGIDTVEYAFLDGEEELFIEQREGFNIDGLEVKARMVFAAKAIDWRGMYRNNGAAQA